MSGPPWTFRGSRHARSAPAGAAVNSRGASPWYVGAITLIYNAALNRAEVPLPGRESTILHGIAPKGPQQISPGIALGTPVPTPTPQPCKGETYRIREKDGVLNE